MTHGGAFLIQDTCPDSIFTPEDFSPEHRMIARSTDAFVDSEILPNFQSLERLDLELTRKLFLKAAEIGLLGIEVPLEYGGLNLDKASATLVAERISRAGSFAVSYGGHTGIGSLPIVYFGSKEQKRRYLPRLVDGSMLAAYALTEAGSGSDALAAKTAAHLTADGQYYILNGEKLWITNAGIADLFIVFAKVDGQHFTAFIVERDFPGVSTGVEERKLGLHGSSTRAVILQDARVPAGNVLGDVGRGAKIALNILNIGRFKLGATCIGGCKGILTDAVRYANRRQQFGRPIAAFGAIQHKLAEMCIRAWIGESAVYRAVGLIDRRLSCLDLQDSSAVLAGIEEYAAECSIIKVLGSEFLDYAADECLQIFGGYGFSCDYPAERYYRDARINRIFEGTNEINRLLISELLLKRSMKGQLPLLETAQDLALNPAFSAQAVDPVKAWPDFELRAVGGAKRVARLILGAAMQKFGDDLANQQEILMAASNIVMDVFSMESALLRVMKIQARQGAESGGLFQEIAGTYINDGLGRVGLAAGEAFAALAEGRQLQVFLGNLDGLVRPMPRNTIAARRSIASAVIAANQYPFC
jgi:alkylation response protein AidB-like acyl-CoA dehydrogenase